jgi:hypothetical protein
MNCQEFQTLLHEMASDGEMENSLQTAATAHLSSCTQCRLRLSDERVLISGLEKLAETLSELEAPSRMEASLLAAFRQHHNPVVRGMRKPWSKAHFRLMDWRWSLAVAGVICLVLGLGFLFLKQRRSAPAVSPFQVAPGITSIARNQEITQPENPLISKTSGNPGVAAAKKASPSKGKGPRKPKVPEKKAFPLEEATPGSGPSEWSDIEYATDFIPFASASDLAPAEIGQVVRVRLPRTAMESFGLPVNWDRGLEPIQADVLLGEDGLARAIRFVQDRETQ